ncbi:MULTISPECIES: hypothetical protein [unclassified Corynebacterium]|uniref:hypothetical protein n=1 Tax=unclassified Corynebacterium TaxID=2624378 RepID=UPI0029CA5ECF|nr:MULTISPECIES: hypothetical protein [unclassified Corynebacterium]
MGFLRSMLIDVPPEHLPGNYLAGVPAVRHLTQKPLRFPTPVTILSGENGAGKIHPHRGHRPGHGIPPPRRHPQPPRR